MSCVNVDLCVEFEFSFNPQHHKHQPSIQKATLIKNPFIQRLCNHMSVRFIKCLVDLKTVKNVTAIWYWILFSFFLRRRNDCKENTICINLRKYTRIPYTFRFRVRYYSSYMNSFEPGIVIYKNERHAFTDVYCIQYAIENFYSRHFDSIWEIKDLRMDCWRNEKLT